jgi:hypothetical protein
VGGIAGVEVPPQPTSASSTSEMIFRISAPKQTGFLVHEIVYSLIALKIEENLQVEFSPSWA